LRMRQALMRRHVDDPLSSHVHAIFERGPRGQCRTAVRDQSETIRAACYTYFKRPFGQTIQPAG
jgi:hypothetical protein